MSNYTFSDGSKVKKSLVFGIRADKMRERMDRQSMVADIGASETNDYKTRTKTSSVNQFSMMNSMTDSMNDITDYYDNKKDRF